MLLMASQGQSMQSLGLMGARSMSKAHFKQYNSNVHHTIKNSRNQLPAVLNHPSQSEFQSQAHLQKHAIYPGGGAANMDRQGK